MRIDPAEFPRYRGLQDLVPGHSYLDETGAELIFLGRGNYWREDAPRQTGWSVACPRSFLYMKAKDLDAKIAKGMLSKDLRTYDPLKPGKPPFWKTVFYSKAPRELNADLGEKYPPGFFENLVVTDLSPKYYGFGSGQPIHWHVTAGNE